MQSFSVMDYLNIESANSFVLLNPHKKQKNQKQRRYDSNGKFQTSGAIHRVGDMRLDDAHRLRGVRHPLGHHQRDCKRSVPSGDRRNRGYPFHYRFLRLHSLVIHPLRLTDMAKRSSKTVEQQCRYYEVDNIFVYMVETYINGNISVFRER